MMATATKAKRVFQGKYLLLAGLGGTNGAVYAGERLGSCERVAIRILDDLAPDVAQLVVERARAAMALRHPILATVVDCGYTEGGAFVVSEYVDGTPIDRWVDEAGIPPLGAVVDLAHRLCQGLAAARARGLGHDTLLAHNLMVLPFTFGPEGRLAVKLVDLGLPVLRARALLDVQSAQFLAPEQVVPVRGGWTSVAGVGERSDVDAVGAVLYFMCTGGLPYRARNIDALVDARARGRVSNARRINPDVPLELGDIAMRALAPAPAERFASLSAMAHALTTGVPEMLGVSGIHRHPRFGISEDLLPGALDAASAAFPGPHYERDVDGGDAFSGGQVVQQVEVTRPDATPTLPPSAGPDVRVAGGADPTRSHDAETGNAHRSLPRGLFRGAASERVSTRGVHLGARLRPGGTVRVPAQGKAPISGFAPRGNAARARVPPAGSDAAISGGEPNARKRRGQGPPAWDVGDPNDLAALEAELESAIDRVLAPAPRPTSGARLLTSWRGAWARLTSRLTGWTMRLRG